jgi:large conductance mechanosensitive channel
MWAEFKEFLTGTNALALAIGVIIGAALGTVVTSLVNDIIMPPIGFILGGVDFSQLQFVLGTSPSGEPVAIRWGAFLNALINFAVIAFVVWRISKAFIRTPPADETTPCPYCKEPNALDATRCRACTSELTPAGAKAV